MLLKLCSFVTILENSWMLGMHKWHKLCLLWLISIFYLSILDPLHIYVWSSFPSWIKIIQFHAVYPATFLWHQQGFTNRSWIGNQVNNNMKKNLNPAISHFKTAYLLSIIPFEKKPQLKYQTYEGLCSQIAQNCVLWQYSKLNTLGMQFLCLFNVKYIALIQ